MNHDDRQRLHDYLDGRLSEDERSRFEQRLARDADLAATVEAYRRLGDDLRELPAELPTGFHARTGERFARRRGASRGLMAWVTWETVGLGAAALLVVAIFVPAMLRDDPALAPHLPDLTRQKDGEDASEEKAVEVKESVPGQPKESVVERVSTPSAEAEKRFAPAPPPPRRTTVPDRDVAEPEQPGLAIPDSRADLADDRTAAAPLRVRRGVAASPAGALATATRSAEMAAGLAPAGGFRIVDDRAEWSTVLAEGELDYLTALSPDFRSERVVLVGPRAGPIDCSRVDVVVGDEIVLAVHPADDPSSGSRTCAVTIPLSPPTVRVVDAP